MTKILLTRKNNHAVVNGILPFISSALGIYMTLTNLSRPVLSLLFAIFVCFSFISGMLFWRTQDLITEESGNLIFQGFFSRLSLPATQVMGIQTEAKYFSTYILLVKTEDAVYSLSIPAPNGKEWVQLRQHLENHKPFPYHLN